MGRRWTTKTPTEAASLGEAHVNSAIIDINRTCQIAMTTMTHYQPSREATVRMLFDDSDLDKLAAVRGLVETGTDIKSYEIDKNITLNIDYDGSTWPAIEPPAMKINPARVQPLLDFVRDASAVYFRFEEVKAVLRWLNRRATPGAARYFFPTVMMLCPDSPALADLKHVPSRYTTPPELSLWTQALKDAATTWASTPMLPNDAVARPRGKLWLTFKECQITHPVSGQRHYSTDPLIFNM